MVSSACGQRSVAAGGAPGAGKGLLKKLVWGCLRRCWPGGRGLVCRPAVAFTQSLDSDLPLEHILVRTVRF